MSIIRMGMSEDGKFGNGYDAIFGPKDTPAKAPEPKKPAKKPATVKKKSEKKK